VGPGAEAAPVTRRRLIAAAVGATAVGSAWVGAWAGPSAPADGRDARHGSHGGGVSTSGDGARIGPHAPPPELRLPALTDNGAKVPIVVEVEHPMDGGHYLRHIAIANPRDPIPSKGEFSLSPINGQAYVAFQARLDDGPSTVHVEVACSAGERWSATRPTRVLDGAGGCAGEAPPTSGSAVERARLGAQLEREIRPPLVRVPRLVRGERIEAGQVIDVQVSIQHPSRTGLGRRGDGWAQVSEPFHLTEMEVFLGGERVSRFTMTPAVSDNPLITFRLRPHHDGVIAVVFRNTRGARFESEQRLRLG
jgi:sulfur-oxidizing protein SoxY